MGLARDRGNVAGHDAAPCTDARLPAERHAGGGRDRLFDRADPTGRIPRHPNRAVDGVPLGTDRVWGVLLFGTLKGIVVAIIASMIGLASQTANPRVSVIGRKRGADVLRPLSPEHPDDEIVPGLLIVRPEGRLFFVNAQNVFEQIDALIAKYQPLVLALDMSRTPDLEYSALQMLIEHERRASDSGTLVWIVDLNPSVLEMVRHSALHARLGRERMVFNAREAIRRYEAMQAGGGERLS